MISPLRATGIVAVGTAVSLAVSVITSKALALLTGPAGVGLYGLMQSALSLAVIVFGLGLGTSLVRLIAESREMDSDRASALRSGAWQLTIAVSSLLTAGSAIFRQPLAQAMFADPALGWSVPLIAAAASLTLVGAIEVATLNGFHRLATITRIAVASSLLGGVGLVGSVVIAGKSGIAPGLLATAAVGCAISLVLAARELARPALAITSGSISNFRSLLGVGIPYTGSQIVGTGAQMLLPVVVLYQLDSHSVGLFRAAWTISTGYLAFVLTAFAQDYYPRVAAAEPHEIQRLIERRTRLVMAIAVPLILGTLALAPIVVDVLYSSEFTNATGILEWQLIGDLLKLPAWALAFAILARGAGRTYFVVELLGGFSLIAGVWFATGSYGLAGAGVGYLISYAIYYVGVWVAARTVAPVLPGRLQLVVLGLVAALIIVNLTLGGAGPIRTGLLLVAAAGVALVAWPRLWRLHLAEEL